MGGSKNSGAFNFNPGNSPLFKGISVTHPFGTSSALSQGVGAVTNNIGQGINSIGANAVGLGNYIGNQTGNQNNGVSKALEGVGGGLEEGGKLTTNVFGTNSQNRGGGGGGGSSGGLAAGPGLGTGYAPSYANGAAYVPQFQNATTNFDINAQQTPSMFKANVVPNLNPYGSLTAQSLNQPAAGGRAAVATPSK